MAALPTRARLGIGRPRARVSGLPQDASEPEVKAAIVFNIARFTQWPAGAGWPRNRPSPSAWQGVTRPPRRSRRWRTLHGHPVRVLPFERVAALTDCRVLFVAPRDLSTEPVVGAAGRKQGAVLTIGDVRGFANRGGMVALARTHERVRFEINPREVEARGLVMSSRLLSLALIVK